MSREKRLEVEDKLKKGDIAWVTANRGIQLFVTQQAPNQATPQE
jgi:Lhr-like helicase